MTPQQEIEAQREFLRHDKTRNRSDHLRVLRRRLAWVSQQCESPPRGPGWPYLVAERHALEYVVEMLERQQREDARRREQRAGLDPG